MMRRAFTLIELLTVIAITAILLGIITVPIFQSFNLTRTAQSYSDAQDRARVLAEQIAREIGNAAGVRDNSGINGSVAVRVPSGPGSDRPDAEVLVPYAKLDLVLPAQGEVEFDTNGNPIFRNDRGDIDPTLTSPRGQIVLPVAPGATIKRYWIGLQDPFRKYANPYDNLLMARSGQRDNLYVVYEAELQPYAFGTGTGNANFFTVDGNGSITDFDDPTFFLPNLDASGNIITNDAKAQRIANWRQRGRVITEVTRYDAILPVYNKSSREVTYDRVSTTPNIFAPRLVPLVQFRPTRVSAESATPMAASRLGEETDNADQIAPDVFTTQYGGWTDAIVRTLPSGYVANNVNANEYLVGRKHSVAGAPTFSIFAFDPDSGGSDVSSGTELFDLSTYDRSASGGSLFPFTEAINAANTRSGWVNNVGLRNLFMAYWIETGRGRVNASFGIEEVASNAPDRESNVPGAPVGNPVGPTQDNGSGAAWGGNDYEINRAFNRAWAEFPTLRGSLHRFLDLRVTRNHNDSGTFGPLHPDPAVGFERARIVPGSEIVYGPDQIAGPNYGQRVRYTRVTKNPGPNQYAINYTDLAEPDYSVAFPGLGTPPASYNEANFLSAVIQPRFKAGYIQFNSDPNVPLPTLIGKVNANDPDIQVSYRFQFTGNAVAGSTVQKDVFSVDYDSRQLISVLLTIRNYPQSSVPNPQTVTLKASAKVRNYLR